MPRPAYSYDVRDDGILRLLVDRLEDHAIFTLDPDGRVASWNEGARRLKRYAGHDVIGQPFSRFYPPEDRADHLPERLLAQAAASGKVENEGWRVRGDGSRFFASIAITALRDPSGRLIGFGKSVRDITDRKRAEAELHKSEQRFGKLVGMVRDYAILMLDTEGTILTWNEGAERVKGYTRDEIIGRNVACFYIEEDIAAGKPAEFLETAAQQGSFACQGWRLRKDGSRFFADIVITAMRDEQGELFGFAKITRDITQRKALENRLWHLAHHDTLTDLPNRRLALAQIESALARAARQNTKVALIFIDLDGFKTMNDRYGHEAGDTLLKIVAQRLKAAVRAEDLTARMGGDEFFVLIERIEDSAPLNGIIGKIESCIGEPVVLTHGTVLATASIGVSLYPDDGVQVDSLIRAADLAMYAAKDRGGKCYAFHRQDMTERALQQAASERELRKALEEGQFRLHYQPIVDIASGRTLSLEALIRWQHPDRGLLGADHIVPPSERSGFIVEIGDWIVREACRQARALRDAGRPDIRIAVNVSTTQMRRGRLLHTVLSALADHGVASRQLGIEVTESTLQNEADCIETLHALRDAGVQLSIDDFGTGYSSLSSLRTLPIHQLKIDKAFIRDIPNAQDSAIIRAVMKLAEQLQLHVVAEGVETEEQRAFLQSEGCTRAQGYLFARPMPAEFLSYLLEPGESAARLPE